METWIVYHTDIKAIGYKASVDFLFQIKFECLLSHQSYCWSNPILALFLYEKTANNNENNSSKK